MAGTSVDVRRDDHPGDHLDADPDTRDDAPSPLPSGRRHARAWIFGTMLVSALISLTAAFVLSKDAVELAANPAAELSCNISSVVSCSTVGLSWQAHVFGFPNPFLGMMAEPVVITIAVASLAGVRFPRWFMAAAQAVYVFGFLFAVWLFLQSYFVIHALCPWCLLVLVSTTAVFITLLHWNVLEDNLYLPRRAQAWALRMVRADVDLYATIGLILVIATMIVLRYGGSLLG